MAGTTDGWDFFISYNQADRAWAEWIAWVLEEQKYRILVQAWDFVPGSNWIRSMQEGAVRSERMIVVLSEDYLRSQFGSAEWQAIWATDPMGVRRRLMTVRVSDAEREGLLAGIVGIDLIGKDELTATTELVEAVAAMISGRRRPAVAPAFPGGSIDKAILNRAPFPPSRAGTAATAAGATTPTSTRTRRRMIADLANALQEVPHLVDVQRDIVAGLEEELGYRLTWDQERSAAIVAFRLVQQCARVQAGLRLLGEIVNGFASGTREEAAFALLVEDWYQP